MSTKSGHSGLQYSISLAVRVSNIGLWPDPSFVRLKVECPEKSKEMWEKFCEKLTHSLRGICRETLSSTANWQNFDISEEFDERDIAANAFIFFAAGFETTAATLSFCVYELSLNTEVQEKLRQEAERVQQKYQKQTPESLKELTYMDMVIKGEKKKVCEIPQGCHGAEFLPLCILLCRKLSICS